MRKILTLAVLAALAFTSCVKEDGTFNRLKPVMPGVNIYNGTMTMHRIAMQPADMAVRLAVIQAEAYKQNPEAINPDLTKVTVNSSNDNLLEKLLGERVTLSQNGTVYKLVFENDVLFEPYQSNGTIQVETNGKRLDETSETEPWSVRLGGDYEVLTLNSGGYNSYTTLMATAAEIKLYRTGNAYQISVLGFRANVENSIVKSNWNSELTFTPQVGSSIAYSDIKGKRFGVKATAGGPSCVTFDGKSSTELSLELNATAANYMFMTSGTALCKLTGSGDHNPEAYKAREVEVEWIDQGDKLRIMLSYNGIIEDMTNFIR